MTHHFLSLAPDNATSLVADEEAAAAAAAACKVNTEAAGDGGSIPDLNVASVEEEEQPPPQPQPQPQPQGELEKGFGSSSSSSWQRQTGRTSSSSTKVVVEPPDWLPQGWIAEVRTREGGSKDKYYFEPVSSRRFRSKVEVLKYLEASKWRADEAAAGGAMAANGALLGCKSPATSLKEAADRLPFLMQSGLDDLRNILAKGPPPLPSPGFHEYWNSSGGRSSWTDYFKLNTSGGGGDSSNGASSSLLQSASGTTSATPHWLDRILNKGPPAQPPPSSSAGATDGFVQSPLHYLHNAGAFHNSWLHIKPPTQNTAYTTTGTADAPWKPSWSWLDAAANSKSRDEPPADTKRPEINLNQAFDPDDEDCWPEARDEDRKGPWKPADQPAGRPLESLWDKAVPITLEHRNFISSQPNGGSAAAVQPPQPQQFNHQHQHQQQQQQHRLSKDGVHFDVLGVRRTSQNKLDRHQEKKRLENLGKTLCKQSGARLLLELKDRSSRLSVRQ